MAKLKGFTGGFQLYFELLQPDSASGKTTLHFQHVLASYAQWTTYHCASFLPAFPLRRPLLEKRLCALGLVLGRAAQPKERRF